MKRVRLNPPVVYVPEKGKPKDLHSGWLDVSLIDPAKPLKKQLRTARLGGTRWAGGWIDYTHLAPEVYVVDQLKDTARLAPGDNYSAYLLHPDKWKALGALALDPPSWRFLPVLSQGGPGKPLKYAKRIVFETPVELVSEPSRKQNPRAWFRGRGVAFARGLAGMAKIHATGKTVRVAEEIVVLADYTYPDEGFRKIPRRK
jgi:hypothetical protein